MNALTALLATAIVVVPGAGASAAAFPRRGLGPATRLASVCAFGYALVALAALALALAGELSRGPFLAAYAVVCLAVWGLAVRRTGWPPRRPARPRLAWGDAVGLTALAGFAVFHWSLSPYLQFGVSTPFRYWADGLEIAQAHDVPTRTLQWGAVYPTTVSKIGLNAFDAVQSLVLGTSSLQAMAALTWFGAVALFVAMWAAAEQLGLRRAAPLVPLVLLAAPASWPLENAISQDAVLFRAENFGRMLALTALALALHCLRERAGRVEHAAAGAVLGVAAVVHLIPVLVAGAMLTLYAAAGRLAGLRLRALATGYAATAGAALAAYVVVLVATRGNLGLQGAQSTANYADYPGGVDPTAFFRTGHRVPLGSSQLGARRLVEDFVERAFHAGDGALAAAFAAFGLLALAAVAAAAVLERRLAPVVVCAIGLTIALVAASIGFAHHYSVMIQSTFGERRLLDYAGLCAALLAAVVAEALLSRVDRLHAAAGAAVVAVVGTAVFAASVSAPPTLTRWQDAAAGAAATQDVYAMVSRQVPCDARLLPNFKSEGVFEAVTGRRSVMEGMSPYLRPDMLDRVLSLVGSARLFFHHPHANHAVLVGEHVDYVLTIPPTLTIGQEGLPYEGPPLSRVPGLRLVASAAGAQLYAVVGAAHLRAGGPAPPRTCSVAPGRA
jgi:hypothetical protein